MTDEQEATKAEKETKAVSKKTDIRDQHELFALEYISNGWNGTEAYLKSHPSCKSKNAAGVGAHHLLRNPKIRAIIDKYLAEKVMGANEIMARLSDEARASIATFASRDVVPFYNKNGVVIGELESVGLDWEKIEKYGHLIKAIKSTKYGPEIELYDSQAAKVHLGRHLGLFAEQPEKDKEGENLGRRIFIPAELIASSFSDLDRDILARKHTEYVIKGGRGSTKSSFVSLIFICLLVNNPNIHGVALRQIANTLRDSVYSQLVWAISKLDEYFPGLEDEFRCLTSPLEITYKPTGQKIYFRGADKPEKIKSIKTKFGHIGLAWFEELDQYHGQEAIRKMEQSIFRGGEEAWEFKTYNPPPTAQNWVNKYVQIPKANQLQHHSTYLDVPAEWLGQTFLDEAEHLKAVNPKAYDHEYLGQVTGTGGMVFENITIHKITDAEIAAFDHVTHGQDWGFYPDPAHYGRVHYDASHRTLYIFGEFRGWKLSNEKLYKKIVEEAGYNPKDLIIADSAEPKSVADYRHYGANCRGAEKGPDSVPYSMKWLQGLTEIVIDNVRCPYAAEEFLSYEYERTKDNEIISEYPDKNNHAIDMVRYATNLIWRKRGQ